MRRRSRRVTRARPQDPSVNSGIRARRVLVVDEEGNRLGEFLTEDAVELAKTRGLDLVLVAANASPPVARIADWGKMKYERKKKAQASTSRESKMKELKVRPKTDDHDMSVKIKRAHRFLSRGDRVKVSVWFRGREHAHHEIGAEQCYRIAEAVDDVASIETAPRMEGRRMHMVLAPDT